MHIKTIMILLILDTYLFGAWELFFFFNLPMICLKLPKSVHCPVDNRQSIDSRQFHKESDFHQAQCPQSQNCLLGEVCFLVNIWFHIVEKVAWVSISIIGPCKPESESWIPSISNLNPDSLHVWKTNPRKVAWNCVQFKFWIQNLAVLKFESRIHGPFEIWIQNPWTPLTRP